MSDELHCLNQKELRPLRSREKNLLFAMLGDELQAYLKHSIPENIRVFDLQDGGMGSIRFSSNPESKFGRAVAEAEYTDEDGVQVSISVNIDQFGQIYELDFWKVDFSSLKRYPESEQLNNIRTFV